MIFDFFSPKIYAVYVIFYNYIKIHDFSNRLKLVGYHPDSRVGYQVITSLNNRVLTGHLQKSW